MQRGLTFMTAFMLASLCYSIVAQLPFLAHALPLSPSPWFVLVLSGVIPAATLGALAVQRNKTWTFEETIDRFCTGMGSVLTTIALANLAWQFIPTTVLPEVQLFLLLTIAALSAAFGVGRGVSNYIKRGMLWIMATWMRAFFMGFVAVLGGTLGFLLTLGTLPSGFIFLGIAVGAAVAVVLVLRMDHLVQQNGP
jgi:hypothetical protein